jgi:hypothetical protein
VTGPEHYAEAENCMKQGCAADERGDGPGTQVWLALAQAHATLALTAATALIPGAYEEWIKTIRGVTP